MKKKLLTLGMALCLVFTMIPFSAEAAFGYGGEPDDVPPTVTFEPNARGSEFYTLNYDSQYGWILEIFAGSDTEVCDVITNYNGQEGLWDFDQSDFEHVRADGIPGGAAVTVTFMGRYPVAYSPRLDSKVMKLSYKTTTYNGKAKKPALKIGKLKQADLVKKGLITVKYSYNTKPGIAKMTIKAGKKAKGKYEGQTTMYFRIAPKKMALTSLTSQKKGELILKWKGQEYASGYNILISESENFEAEKTHNFTIHADKFNSMAFKEAMRQAQPILMEPIMKVSVIVPDEYTGTVIGDLSSRRGQIQGQEARTGTFQVDALVPLSEMFGYTSDLRSNTQGRGQYSMEPHSYMEVPKNIAEKIMSSRKK